MNHNFALAIKVAKVFVSVVLQ